jgi:hypothetical protein
MSHPSDEAALPKTSVLAEALAECKLKAGYTWEPKLVDTLELLVIGLQQGLSLPVIPPKINAGMWLIDTQMGNEVKIGGEIHTYAHGH